MEYAFALLLGYALGSIPFGLILTKLSGAGDLRAIGSGNIGATNVLRTGRKGLAAATLLLDMAKGFAAVLIAARLWPEALQFAAAGAILGHCFPVWLRFRGGKGVATLMGVCLGLSGVVGLTYALVWIAVLAVTRISSLAGMSAAVSAPLAAMANGRPDFALVLALLAALVLFLHRTNIARLRDGTEPRVGSGKARGAEE
jgi:glycerol-3-phosphate acyltransferase PlsY